MTELGRYRVIPAPKIQPATHEARRTAPRLLRAQTFEERQFG
jgi:hypothetical protein